MISRIWGRLEEGVIASLLAAMTLLTFAQVVLRYVFNSGMVWALEATFYLFAWLIMVGIAYCVRVHAHIGIDLIVKMLPAVPRRTVGLIAIALSILYAVLMAWGSWNYTERMMMLGIEAEDIPVERWMLSIILPIGFALLGVRLLEQGWLVATGRAEGFQLADEVAEAMVLDARGKTPGTEDTGPGRGGHGR
ncbi:C4-dicarboxylate ABC transporter permease [Tistrella bauzanensis]|uniref:TRAP transporter small permease protein n=2 Tax=Tistrella bauzanensis TaxID=657419 RepID=A0ABQ1IHB0_9PROT|nr:C4-dicarboxylate ABC transporter permease [Tistrella bauzanensis]